MNSSSTIKSYKQLDPKEEHIADWDMGIYETVLTFGNLTKIKSKISKNPNLISSSFCSSLFEVTIEPTFPFPDFILWIAKNYIKSNHQVFSFDRNLICTIWV